MTEDLHFKGIVFFGLAAAAIVLFSMIVYSGSLSITPQIMINKDFNERIEALEESK